MLFIPEYHTISQDRTFVIDSDKTSYIALRNRWLNPVVLNVLVTTVDNSNEDSSYGELEQVFDHFHNNYEHSGRGT